MCSTLTALLGHLCQQNMITEMRSTCPKVAEICWLSCHLQHHGNPTKIWSIFMHAVSALATESKTVFVSLLRV